MVVNGGYKWKDYPRVIKDDSYKTGFLTTRGFLLEYRGRFYDV